MHKECRLSSIIARQKKGGNHEGIVFGWDEMGWQWKSGRLAAWVHCAHECVVCIVCSIFRCYVAVILSVTVCLRAIVACRGDPCVSSHCQMFAVLSTKTHHSRVARQWTSCPTQKYATPTQTRRKLHEKDAFVVPTVLFRTLTEIHSPIHHIAKFFFALGCRFISNHFIQYETAFHDAPLRACIVILCNGIYDIGLAVFEPKIQQHAVDVSAQPFTPQRCFIHGDIDPFHVLLLCFSIKTG